jgi:beta-phosphoglucomutase
MAAKLLNIEPENSIVFEDSVAGIQAANIAK